MLESLPQIKESPTAAKGPIIFVLIAATASFDLPIFCLAMLNQFQ